MAANAPVYAPEAFGPNGDAVVELLGRPAAAGPRLKVMTDAGRELVHAVFALPGTGSPDARLAEFVSSLSATADALSPNLRQHIALVMADEFGVGAMMAANKMEGEAEALDLLEAAVLWPAVYGRHPNPFAPVVTLARAGIFVTHADGNLLMWHSGIAVPLKIQELVVASKMPPMTVA